MSVVIPRETSYFFSTATQNENATVSADKSRLTLSMEDPIMIPPNAVSCSVEVETASIWNTSPNISADLGNNVFDYSIGGVAQPQIIIPDGLYSISSLNSEISRQLVNDGNDGAGVVFTGNTASQKSIMTFKTGYQAVLTDANSVRTILGFDSAVYPAIAPVVDGESVESQNIASFNNVNSFTIISNLVSNGVPLNTGTGRNVLGIVPITSAPGSQVNYVPQNPLKVDSSELRGNIKQNFYLEIGDETATALPQTENWSLVLVFRYYLLMSDTTVPMLPP